MYNKYYFCKTCKKYKIVIVLIVPCQQLLLNTTPILTTIPLLLIFHVLTAGAGQGWNNEGVTARRPDSSHWATLR